MRFAKERYRINDSGPHIIGIAGAARGMGATHLTLMLANYLQGACGRRTAVLEWNNHGDFSRFGKLCTGQKKEKDCYRIQGVDYYPLAGADCLIECVDAGYQQVLIDFGTIEEKSYVEFIRCHAVWILMSFSEWQMEAFGELAGWEESRIKENWQFFTVFGSEESRIEWNKRRKPKILRVPLSVDAFTVTRELMEWGETAIRRHSFSGNVSRQGLLKRKRNEPRVRTRRSRTDERV